VREVGATVYTQVELLNPPLQSRVVSYEKRKIWKCVFLVLKHRFLPLSKPLPLLRGEALKEDFNFSLLV
jgi:hypothetical protein